MSDGVLLENNLHYWYPPRNNLVPLPLPTGDLRGTISGILECGAIAKQTQNPATIVSTNHAHFQHTYFDDYYLRIHLIPKDANFGMFFVPSQKNMVLYNTYLTPVSIESLAIVDLDEAQDGLSHTGLESMPVAIPALSYAVVSILADIDAINKSFEGFYNLGVDIKDGTGTTTLDSVLIEIYTTGLRSTTFNFSPFKNIQHKMSWKTRIVESVETEQRASLISAPYETISYKYRIPRDDANSILLAERETAALPVGVPMWIDAIRIEHLEKEATEITGPFKGNSFADGQEFLVWENDGKAEILSVDTLDYLTETLALDIKNNEEYSNAFIMPIRTGFANKGRKVQSYSNGLIKVEVEFELTTIHPVMNNDSLLTYHRSRPLLIQKNFQKVSKESFGGKFEKFEGGGFGKSFYPTTERVFYQRDYVWQCNNRADIDTLTYFLHHIKGRWKSFYVPSFRPDFELALDVDSMDTSIFVRFGRGKLSEDTLLNRSICIFLTDGTFIAKEIIGLVSEQYAELFTSGALGKSFTTDEVSMICMLDLMRSKSDTVTVKYMDVDDVTCKLSLISTFDDEEYL